MKTALFGAAVVVAVVGAFAFAQPGNRPGPGEDRPDPQGHRRPGPPPQMAHHGPPRHEQGPPNHQPPGPPPPTPLFDLIDQDQDGMLSSGELAAAAESLKKLDKNGDGQITFREAHPPKGPPPGHAHRGDCECGHGPHPPRGDRPEEQRREG